MPFTDINYGVLISLGCADNLPDIKVRLGYVKVKQLSNVTIVIVDASGQLVPDAPNGITVSIVSL